MRSPGTGGDLNLGKAHKSAIGILVGRFSRFVALVHLCDNRQPTQMCDALIQTVSSLPAQPRRFLTWDDSFEMHVHTELRTPTDMPVSFYDPGSPRHHGSHENTNSLLKQYSPQDH